MLQQVDQSPGQAKEDFDLDITLETLSPSDLEEVYFFSKLFLKLQGEKDT